MYVVLMLLIVVGFVVSLDTLFTRNLILGVSIVSFLQDSVSVQEFYLFIK